MQSCIYLEPFSKNFNKTWPGNKPVRLGMGGLLQTAKLFPLYIMWSVVSLLLAGVIIATDDGFLGPHNEHVDRHQHGSI